MVRHIIFFAFLFFYSHPGLAVTDSLPKVIAPLGSEAGIRIGVSPAITYRFMPAESHMVELLFARTGRSLLFTALYQKQQAVFGEGLYYRYGGGFSVGGWNQRLVSGFDMQIGLDYYLPIMPLVFSLDMRPWVRITGLLEANGELAASLRYVF